MKKIIQFFNSPFFSPVAIIFLLYLCWLLTININESLFTGLILFPVFLIVTGLAKLSEKHWGTYLLMFFLLPISIYKAGQYFWTEIFFTFVVGVNSYIWGGLLSITLFFIYLANTFANKANTNRKNVISLFLFIATLPLFLLNFGYYFPRVTSERARFGQYTYLLFDSQTSDFHPYLAFYKCSRWEFNCELLYRSKSPTIGWEIIIDQQKKEVSLFDDVHTNFLYTDGKNPRYYAYGRGGILKNNIYSLSEECIRMTSEVTCGTYTYIPYKCNINGTSCNPIPMRYTTNYDYYYYWIENELQNEISLYISTDTDEILIFTYGVHSRCYVDGCEISKQISIEP